MTEEQNLSDDAETVSNQAEFDRSRRRELRGLAYWIAMAPMCIGSLYFVLQGPPYVRLTVLLTCMLTTFLMWFIADWGGSLILRSLFGIDLLDERLTDSWLARSAYFLWLVIAFAVVFLLTWYPLRIHLFEKLL